MNIGDFDESRGFGDKEDVFFEEEEVALDGFEVGFETWIAFLALEATGAYDLLASECAEHVRDDFICGFFIVLLELAIVLGEILAGGCYEM
jgi:hypothetical protein